MGLRVSQGGAFIHGLNEAVAPTGVVFDPPELHDETVRLLELLLMAVRDPDVPLDSISFGPAVHDVERFTGLACIARARPWYARAARLQPEFALGWERVHEVGARGPGRAMRLTGKWRTNEGTITTHTCYPRQMTASMIASAIELHLEHCAQAL
jgi:hypothetical protein